MNITSETARELYDRGFTYRHYQEDSLDIALSELYN